MSQEGILSAVSSTPQIPTTFVANSGSAVPALNVINILGVLTSAGSTPINTTASGNTVDINVQKSQAIASSNTNNVGLAAFNSADFTVDSNGFVSLVGSAAVEEFMVDASTPPGTNPVQPNGSGIVTITGGQVAAGTSTNVIRTNSLSANTYTIQIQRSQAVASSTVGDNGVSHFNSSFFTVDGNGFVSLSGTTVGQTITGNSGGALSPTAGNWNILGSGSITTAGSVSTLTVELTGLTNHAVQVGGSGTTLTQVGPSATSGAVLASNGASSDPSFQTLSSLGSILTITGNSGGAEVPSAGNFNILGTGSVTVAGSDNTETVQLTGLTNHNVLVGAGSATITNVAPSATSGIPLVSNGSSSDPSFTTALIAGGGTASTSFNTTGVVISGATSTTALTAVTLTDGQLAIGSSAGNPAAATLTAGTGISITNGHNSITISTTGTTTLNVTSVNNAASPYTVLGTDDFLACQTSTGLITIKLPNAPATGRVFIVKDSNGSASTSNISVTTVGGAVTIDGLTTYKITSNYGAINVIFDGTNYEVF